MPSTSLAYHADRALHINIMKDSLIPKSGFRRRSREMTSELSRAHSPRLGSLCNLYHVICNGEKKCDLFNYVGGCCVGLCDYLYPQFTTTWNQLTVPVTWYIKHCKHLSTSIYSNLEVDCHPIVFFLWWYPWSVPRSAWILSSNINLNKQKRKMSICVPH